MSKPGYKTTEFWLSLVAMLIGAYAASGALEATSTLIDDQIVGMIIAAFSAMGYGAFRAHTKASEVKGAAIIEASKADPR